MFCFSLGTVPLMLGFGSMALQDSYDHAWGWRWGWIVYPVAGVLCGLADHLIRKGEE